MYLVDYKLQTNSNYTYIQLTTKITVIDEVTLKTGREGELTTDTGNLFHCKTERGTKEKYELV